MDIAFYQIFKRILFIKKAQTVFIDDRSFMVNPKLIRMNSTYVLDIHGLIPNYLRRTEAENNYDQKR